MTQNRGVKGHDRGRCFGSDEVGREVSVPSAGAIVHATTTVQHTREWLSVFNVCPKGRSGQPAKFPGWWISGCDSSPHKLSQKTRRPFITKIILAAVLEV
jgi:hypothetical protein